MSTTLANSQLRMSILLGAFITSPMKTQVTHVRMTSSTDCEPSTHSAGEFPHIRRSRFLRSARPYEETSLGSS